MGKLYRLPRSYSYVWLRALPLGGIFIITLMLAISSISGDTAPAKLAHPSSINAERSKILAALEGQVSDYANISNLALEAVGQPGLANTEGIVQPDQLNNYRLATENVFVPSINDINIDLLAGAIEAVATGEPYLAKVAVGAVLINRLNHHDFPNTLSGVIYQPQTLGRLISDNGNNPGSYASRQAAYDAAAGWDPSYGSLFFWNPDTATDPWVWTREVVVRHGSHVFGR